MATRNKRKPAALNKENCREHPKSNWAQNLNVPRSQEDYITQVSEEIEGRVIKKLSQEFSRTENHILGALARLDHFLTNPLIQGQSGPVPETSRNIFSISQGTNEDDSQSNPYIEAGVFNNPMTQNSGPEDGHDMVLGVHEEVTHCTLVLLQESRKRTALQVYRNSAVKTHLRRLRQTKICGPVRSWQTTTILRISITKLTEFPNYQSHLRQRCPRSTGILKSSSCLKIFSNGPQNPKSSDWRGQNQTLPFSHEGD